MKIAGMIQLKSGDAVSGLITRRLPWFRFLRIEAAELHEARTQTTTRADGVIFVPRGNVLFIQKLLRVVADRPVQAGPATFPGPLTSHEPTRDSADGRIEARR